MLLFLHHFLTPPLPLYAPLVSTCIFKMTWEQITSEHCLSNTKNLIYQFSCWQGRDPIPILGKEKGQMKIDKSLKGMDMVDT